MCVWDGFQFIRLEDMQLPTELSYESQAESSNLMFGMKLSLKDSDWELFSISLCVFEKEDLTLMSSLASNPWTSVTLLSYLELQEGPTVPTFLDFLSVLTKAGVLVL